MKRLFAILLLGFLALGIAGLSAGGAAAGPAQCAPNAAQIQDDGDTLAELAALTEQPSARRNTLSDGPQYACNSQCARSCAARFGRCPTRQCRQQFNACVRGCGC